MSEIKENEVIKPGKYVEMVYDLYSIDPETKEEKLVHQSDPQDPEAIIFGVTRGVVEPLEKALDGLSVDSTFDVVATADQAFGKYDPEQVVELDRDIFTVDGNFDDEVIKVGANVPMLTADGFRIAGKVLEITPDKVKMDFNHPLVGKDVRFKGKVLTVRDATAEELQPAGCGCGCDSCGDDCNCDADHNCGHDGCGCGK